jgi:glycosyltransferase involved in cell wall biosynthesis
MSTNFLNATKRRWSVSKTTTDILFLSHRYNVTSGGEKALIDMITYLVSIGIKPHVIIGDSGDIIEHLKPLDVPYSIVYLPFWMHSGNDPTSFEFTSANPTVNTTLQIVNLIKELKPKLCVTNTMVIPWLGYASSITNVPHAWMIHEIGAGFNFRYAIGEAQTLRTIDSLSDKIFYNSLFTAQHYTSKFEYNKSADIVYPSGNIESDEHIQSPFAKTNEPKLVVVGPIKKQKGQMDSVRAVHELVKQKVFPELLLVGSVEEQVYHTLLKQYIKKHGLEDCIKFLGHIDKPLPIMEHADVVINCATNESFGRVTVEGMFLKKPVIGANSAGTAEILDSGTHGLLYEPGDYKQLSKHIRHLHNNPEAAKKMGQAAHASAQKRYSVKESYRPFVAYYEGSIQKTALSLQPIDAVITDFHKTVSSHRRLEKELHSIRLSRPWQAISSLRRVKHRVFSLLSNQQK